jgi:flagellar motility protein MotE (MotC chaperone)
MDAAARARAHGAAGAPPPPPIASRALADELRRASRERDADRSAIARERAHLEALKKEIAESRAALRKETQRLEGLVAAFGAKESNAHEAMRAEARAKETPGSLDTLTKTVKGMRARQSAAMLARLDRGLAAAVLGRMRPAEAAAVIEKMEVAAGAEILALLAGRNRP